MRSLKVAHEAKESAERSRAACEEASQATVIAAEGAAADALKAQEASLTAQNRASDAFTSSFTGMQSVLSLSEKITTFARDAASKVLDNWSSLSTQVSTTMIVHGSEVHEYMQSVTKSLNSSQGLIKNIEGAAVQHEALERKGICVYNIVVSSQRTEKIGCGWHPYMSGMGGGQ